MWIEGYMSCGFLSGENGLRLWYSTTNPPNQYGSYPGAGYNPDLVSVTIVEVDMDMDGVSDNEEETVGGFVAVGGLKRLVLNRVQPPNLPIGSGHYMVLYLIDGDADKIKLWDNPQKTGTPFTLSYPISFGSGMTWPYQFWIEGLEASEAGVCVYQCESADCETCFEGSCIVCFYSGECIKCENGACVSSCSAGECCSDDTCVSSCPPGKCCDDGVCESSCPTDKCCDDGVCVSSCPAGKCCEDGVCEVCDADKCRECIDGSCESICTGNQCCNGAGTCVALEDWSEWDTAITFELPPGWKEKIQDAVNKIPGVDITLSEAYGFYSSEKKDCCDNETLSEDGERWREVGVTLSADIDDIPIWGPPPIEEEFEIWGVLRADVTIDAGLRVVGGFSVTGKGGKRWDDCDDEECLYASLECDVDVGIGPKFEVDVCYETAWGEHENCFSITAEAIVSVNISGSAGYNSKTSCDEGLYGDIDLGNIVFTGKLKIGDTIGFQASYPIYP